MRIKKIVNILAPFMCISIWLLLYIFNSRYAGPGYKSIPKSDQKNDISYFSTSFPLLVIKGDTLYGLTSIQKNGSAKCNGLWHFSISRPELIIKPFPNQILIDTLLAINFNDSGTLALAGMSHDSLLQIICYDSIIKSLQTVNIKNISLFRGMDWKKNEIEIVLGRDNRQFGKIVTINDTSYSERIIELPGFFDRICDIEVAYKENNLWKFLLSTNYYKRDSVWILLGNPNKTNFLVFDENAVYPEYPGILHVNKSTFPHRFDRSNQGFLPTYYSNDSCIAFDGKKFFFFNNPSFSDNYCLSKSIYLSGPTKSFSWLQYGLIDSINQSIHTFSFGKLSPLLSFPVEINDSAISVNEPGDSKEVIISLGLADPPELIFKLPSGAVLLLTRSLHFALMDTSGNLLDRKSFVTLIHKTISDLKPGEIELLDMKFPSAGAIMWYLLLYSLPVLLIMSLMLTWLIQQLRKKPRFNVRKKKQTIGSRLIPGSVIYLILVIIFGFGFLHQLNIF